MFSAIKLLTNRQVIVRIAIVIFVAELLIMLFFTVIPALDWRLLAMFDALLLSLLTAPVICFWVIKPFVKLRDEALQEINILAHTDALTQIPNRLLIIKHLDKLIAESIRHKDYGALLLLDLDGFKAINDTYGHEAGDSVLIEVGKRVSANLRVEDDVGRFGGDEFIALIKRLGGDKQIAKVQAQSKATELIHHLNKPYDYEGNILNFGASIGIRMIGFQTLDALDALHDADTAMFQAKKAGKGIAVIFE